MISAFARSAQVLDKQTVLRAHPLFAHLGPDAITRLTSFSHLKSVPAGATIFRKGDVGDCLYAVYAGTVKISNRFGDGRDTVFNVIYPGEILGELALLDGGARASDAQAITDCDLMVIERRDFIPVVDSDPVLARKIIEQLCVKLRHATEQVEDVVFLNLPGRLAKTLLWLTADTKSASGKVSITQREIGEIIGMTRESTNKQLRAWEAQDWVRLERGSVLVLQPEPLEEIAGTVHHVDS
jgi:CRP/FNR family cyclic AMP-dependent transcriptional regulator